LDGLRELKSSSSSILFLVSCRQGVKDGRKEEKKKEGLDRLQISSSPKKLKEVAETPPKHPMLLLNWQNKKQAWKGAAE
jgi:hypothetical protein